MKDLTKYQGIFPAFYACYDKNGAVDPTAVRALTRWLMTQGVQGLYVGGSSGECIYQSKEDRKLLLENVMAEAKGKLTVIAHVACNNTADSQELAAHAQALGVDAIAAIAKYWNDISSAASNTDFIIYNIPQLAGVSLTVPLLEEMLKNPRVIGVKNSSRAVQDIQMFADTGCIVFNGPDEQLISGLVMGAIGGIGGTYGAMPKLYVELFRCVKAGEMAKALEIQNDCCRIIYKMCSAHGNLYAIIKEILRKLGGPDCGSVRAPLAELAESDYPIAEECAAMIRQAISKYC